MRKPGRRSLRAAVVLICFLPALLSAQERPLDAQLPLTVGSVNEVIIIDRLIADRAYVNIRAGRPADHGIDFALLDREMEKYRPELEKFDPVYYGALRDTYERMKSNVLNPSSDFIRAIREPGSVEFKGRSPLPAAAFADTASHAPHPKSAGRPVDVLQSGSGRGIDELEPFLSDNAKKTLSDIRKIPETTDAELEIKLKAIEKAIAACGKYNDRLEAEVMLRILRGMQAPLQTASTRLDIDADMLPGGITQEMFDKMYNPPESIPTEPTAGESTRKIENPDRQQLR